jgi:hypothetical protein
MIPLSNFSLKDIFNEEKVLKKIVIVTLLSKQIQWWDFETFNSCLIQNVKRA